MTGRLVLKGAFGFVGSAFWRALRAAGTPFDVLTYENAESLRRDDVDMFIDCSGNSKKYLADQDPEYDRRKNVDEVAENISRFRPKQYVHVSSSAVYSDTGSHAATRETDEPTGEVSVYGLHKREAERVVRSRFARPLILRPAGFIGPGLSKGPVYDLLEGEPPRLASSSLVQLLDVDLFAAAALHLYQVGGTYNAVPDESTRLEDAFPLEVAAQLQRFGDLTLPKVRFALDCQRFSAQCRRLGLAGCSLPSFVAQYYRQELRQGVPVLVLAGGKSTRIGGPLPKPAMPLAGEPLICRAVRPYVNAGYTRVVALLGHGADEVDRALKTDPSLHNALRVVEPAPLGTGGAVLSALRTLECETAIVINGDTLLGHFAPVELVKHHIRVGAAATLLAGRVEDATRFGTLQVAPAGRLVAFREKAAGQADLVYAGVAVVNRRRLLQQWPLPQPASLEEELLPALAAAGDVQVFAKRGLRFVDAGTPEGWAQASEFVRKETSC